MATQTKAPRVLSEKQLQEMLALTRKADTVELKLTVPDANQRSAVSALEMDPLDAQIRQVVLLRYTRSHAGRRRGRRPRAASPGAGPGHRRQAAPARSRRRLRRGAETAGLRRRGGCHAGRVRLFGIAQGAIGSRPCQSGCPG